MMSSVKLTLFVCWNKSDEYVGVPYSEHLKRWMPGVSGNAYTIAASRIDYFSMHKDLVSNCAFSGLINGYHSRDLDFKKVSTYRNFSNKKEVMDIASIATAAARIISSRNFTPSVSILSVHALTIVPNYA